MTRTTAIRRRHAVAGALTALGSLGAIAGPAGAGPCCGGLAPPDLPILIVDGDSQEYEAAGQAWVTITRNQTGTPLEVAVAIEHGDTGVADFEVAPTWSFAAGVSKITRAISLTEGDGVEPAETFTVRVEPHDGQGFASADPEVDITILDGNGPQLEIIDSQAPEGDAPGGGSLPVKVQASYAPLHDLTFRLYSGVFGSEAEPGADFTPIDQLVTLPAGSDTVEVSLPVVGDDLDEDDELVPVYAENPSHGAFPVGDGSAEMRILDDDLPGEGVGAPVGPAASGGPSSGSASGAPSFSQPDGSAPAVVEAPAKRLPVRQEVGDQLTGRLAPAALASVEAEGDGPPLGLALVGGWALIGALWMWLRRRDRRAADEQPHYGLDATATD